MKDFITFGMIVYVSNRLYRFQFQNAQIQIVTVKCPYDDILMTFKNVMLLGFTDMSST